MAVKNLEQFKEMFASGDFTPDRMLEIAEDVADTFNDFSNRTCRTYHVQRFI